MSILRRRRRRLQARSPLSLCSLVLFRVALPLLAPGALHGQAFDVLARELAASDVSTPRATTPVTLPLFSEPRVRWCLPVRLGLPPDAAGDPGRREVHTLRSGSLCRVSPEGEEGLQAVGLNPVSPGRAFLYSAVLPGAGQRLLGQGRWVPYLALEVWGWAQFFLRRSEGERLQREYRDLAWEVARVVSVGARQDGDFPYYESLTEFRASGAFDQDPLRAGVQPETDPETFNGALWELAGEIFFPPDSDVPPPVDSPEYARALEYYLDRSVTPRFAWSWADNTLQQASFSQLIEESDEELRGSTNMIGVILANHFVSAIDALISARLRSLGRDGDEITLSSLAPSGFHGWGVQLTLRP